MAGTQVTMQRYVSTVAGTNHYNINTACIVAGTLPDTHIFLLDILTADDPKDDVLNRICEVADFSAYKKDRDAAIVASDVSWRSSSVILSYSDIETANAAWKELSKRINTLVENYDAFLEDFETFDEGALIVYPTADESTVTALKTAYTEANEALQQAEEARNTKVASCSTHDQEIVDIEKQRQDAQADLDALTAIQANVTACSATYATLQPALVANNNQIRTLVATSSAIDDEQSAINGVLQSNDAYLLTFAQQNTALNGVVSALAARVAVLQTRINTLQQEKNALFAELTKCNAEIAKSQALVDAAQEQREAALAAVVAVCPDFVP